MATVKQLFTFDYLGRTECSEVGAGDIAAVVVSTPPTSATSTPIPRIPSSSIPSRSILHLVHCLRASTSPLVGRDGDIVGARQLKERLFNERENNVTMRIEELADKSGVEVSGRGILHLSFYGTCVARL